MAASLLSLASTAIPTIEVRSAVFPTFLLSTGEKAPGGGAPAGSATIGEFLKPSVTAYDAFGGVAFSAAPFGEPSGLERTTKMLVVAFAIIGFAVGLVMIGRATR